MTARRFMDLSGQQFGRLTVISLVERASEKGSRTRWLCRCNCGTEKTVFAEALRNGNTKSCGCLSRELTNARSKTHGETLGRSRSPEYRVWIGIIHRCENSNATRFENYGGRGIKMCQRWRENFDNFLADMGRKPSANHSIERIDNDGDYQPNNCRWADKQEQAFNRRKRRRKQGDAIHAALTANPMASNRAIARKLGLTHGTVARARRDMINEG